MFSGFLAVCAALMLDRLIAGDPEYRRMAWFQNYVDRIHGVPGLRNLTLHPVGPLLVLGPGLILTQWVDALVEGLWFGGLSLVYGTLLLLYCLGPRNLERQADDFLEAVIRGDGEAQHAIATSMDSAGSGDDPLPRRVSLGILVEANERMMAPVFWFLVLGPLGAVLVRGTSLLRAEETGSRRAGALWALRLAGILDWLPVRLLAVGYAVTGAFDPVVGRLRRSLWDVEEPVYERNRTLLRDAGACALIGGEPVLAEEGDTEAQVRSALALVTRAMVAWLALFAAVLIGILL